MKYLSVCSGIEAASVAWKPLGWTPVAFSEIEPFPCAVLKSRFPEVPNLGDMSKIHFNHETNELTNGTTTVLCEGGIDLLVGGTPCFTEGTMVLTPRGYVGIESLSMGDFVVSADGNICKISAIGRKMAEVGTIKILGRPKTTCTPNHPFLCVDMKKDHRRKSQTCGHKIPNGNFEYVEAEKSVGKYAGRISAKPSPEPIFPYCYGIEKEDLIELAGWYVGDGYIRRYKGKNKKSVILCLCCQEKIRKFEERFGGKVHYCKCSDGKIHISCTKLAEWLVEHFGEYSYGKRIPYWLYLHESKSRFLEGYIATDGSDVNTFHQFITVSPALAFGIGDLCPASSICFHLTNQHHVIEGRIVNQRPYYVIRISKMGLAKIHEAYGRTVSEVKSYDSITGDVFRRQWVYNITVEDDHTYIANGIAVHNCQSWSSAGTRTGLDGASGLAYHFARLVGEVRPRWFVWENVEGCLTCRTHGDTRDFNFLLHSFASGGNPGLGPRWHVCWRVLDAQYVRVDGFPRAIPQRRKRIFLVGRLAEPGVDTCEVLLEPEGVLGDDRPRRQAGEVRAGGLPACSLGTGVAEPVERRIINYKADLAGGEPDTAMVTGDHDSRPTDFTNVIVTRDVAPDGSVHRSARRITPIEGERLQGFPDGWTRPCFTKEQIEDDETIDEFIGVHATWNAINGKPDAKAKTMKSIQKWMETLSSDKCPEGARYKAIGNSMPVNSMRWIGMRIEESERNRK